MKKLMLSIAILGFGTLAMAQQRTMTPEAREQKRLERQKENLSKMQNDLGLNDAQVAKIKDLRDREMMQGKSEREALKAERKQKMERHNQEMKTILTPAQYEKWNAQKAEKRAEMKEKMKKRKMKAKY